MFVQRGQQAAANRLHCVWLWGGTCKGAVLLSAVAFERDFLGSTADDEAFKGESYLLE